MQNANSHPSLSPSLAFLAELTLILVANRCRNLALCWAGVDIQGGIQNEQC